MRTALPRAVRRATSACAEQGGGWRGVWGQEGQAWERLEGKDCGGIGSSLERGTARIADGPRNTGCRDYAPLSPLRYRDGVGRSTYTFSGIVASSGSAGGGGGSGFREEGGRILVQVIYTYGFSHA
jgi:hypothetical protein